MYVLSLYVLFVWGREPVYVFMLPGLVYSFVSLCWDLSYFHVVHLAFIFVIASISIDISLCRIISSLWYILLCYPEESLHNLFQFHCWYLSFCDIWDPMISYVHAWLSLTLNTLLYKLPVSPHCPCSPMILPKFSRNPYILCPSFLASLDEKSGPLHLSTFLNLLYVLNYCVFKPI